MSLGTIKNHDSYLLRGDGESRGAYCERHEVDYEEGDACPVCYERDKQAEKLRAERKARLKVELRDSVSVLNSAFSEMGEAFRAVREW